LVKGKVKSLTIRCFGGILKKTTIPPKLYPKYSLKSANLPGFVDNQPDVKIKRVKPGRFYLYKNQLIKEIGC
jgi:hypothetical protein